MKQLLLTLSIVMTGAMILPAQNVEEVNHPMVMGTHSAFYIDIPGATSSFLEKEWKDFINPYGKAKKVKKSNEWLVEGTQILNIGGVNTLNLYSRSEETGVAARQYLWIDMGGQFISSGENPEAVEHIEGLLRDFAHKVDVDLIAIELDSQQKALENLEKDLQKLKKDNDSYHKTIEDAKERIARAESDIAKNVQDQQLRMQEIEMQRKVVEEVQVKLDQARAKGS